MSSIRFDRVTKRFGDNLAVIEDLDLAIENGEFVVLVGPSGCAKSTTLRLIAGLEQISAGTLWIGDRPANDLPPKDRNIAMVFQSYALFPNMTVRGNLSFGMQIRGEPRARIVSEVTRIAELLGLTALLDRRPRELSGGQAQRVALGRAMIRQPGAFLFDEPLSNLDAELRVNMRAEISRMQRSLGVTTVYVTHDQTEAMTMGDRVAVMNSGRIMQFGAPLELYRSPANLFVAGFIGSPRMNLVPLRDNPWLSATLPNGLDNDPVATIGFRPEHVRLAGGAVNSDAISLSGRVAWIEGLGHETLVKVEMQSGQEAITLRADGDAVSRIGLGDPVSLTLPLRHLMAFDDQGERRL